MNYAVNTPSLIPLDPEQFRMSRLQVHNWGTFNGTFRIAIARKGVLFAGMQGSGKSTLLDAITSVLMPPRIIAFNAAASGGDGEKNDRNNISYIRGAWGQGTNQNTREVATRFLRANSTWSAIALTYQTQFGRSITLVQMFWVRGAGCRTQDVHVHYMVLEREFDLSELEVFALSDFSLRRLKDAIPGKNVHFDSYPAYGDRLRHLLGIESEMAMRLLNKAQYTKDLSNLNEFLRSFMLDEPETIKTADQLVLEFVDLRTAYAAVKQAREQLEVLRGARKASEERATTKKRITDLDEVITHQDIYRDLQRRQLLTEFVKQQRELVDKKKAQVEELERVNTRRNDEISRLREQRLLNGGSAIERLKQELANHQKERDDRDKRRTLFKVACDRLKWPMPTSAIMHVELVNRARDTLETAVTAAQDRDQQHRELYPRQDTLQRQLAEVVREIEALKVRESNIPAHMLEMRQKIVDGTGLTEDDLPFVGELIEVLPDSVAWTGAIERLLHGFAMSIVVDESHSQRLATYVNRNNLGGRLLYNSIALSKVKRIGPAAPDMVRSKLRLRDGKWAAWIDAQLDDRFDYACVADVQELQRCERGLTVTGLVRHGRSRFEKDDRSGINDRKQWVLGFDNREKIALFDQQRTQIQDELDRIDQTLRRLKEAQDAERGQSAALQRLVDTGYDDIDVAPIHHEIQTKTKELEALENGNNLLKDLGERISKLEQEKEVADRKMEGEKTDLYSLSATLKNKEDALDALLSNPALVPATPHQAQQLAALYAQFGPRLTEGTLDSVAQKIRTELQNRRDDLIAVFSRTEKDIEKAMVEFRNKWPIDAANLDSTIACLPDYLSILDRLEFDNLPMFEDRFFDLMRTQGHQKLLTLLEQLKSAREDIDTRLEMVNEALGSSDYNIGTHLKVDAEACNQKAVEDFKKEIQRVLHNSLSEERGDAETRYKLLADLVDKFDPKKSADRHWRDSMLDVRRHVEFVAREYNENNEEVDVFKGGSGKSGGQKQKLATTVLAAAMRYQLGGSVDEPSSYGTIVLDEAFDKTDHEATRQVIEIFVRFGFQVVVATPMKNVMSMEPYIGGATFVENADRNASTLLHVGYCDDENRLDLPLELQRSIRAAEDDAQTGQADE